jgi:hypothetical protein
VSVFGLGKNLLFKSISGLCVKNYLFQPFLQQLFATLLQNGPAEFQGFVAIQLTLVE